LLQLGQRALVRLRRSGDDSEGVSPERRMAQYLGKFGVHYCDQPPEYVRSSHVTRRILARLNREVRAVGARLLVMSVPAMKSTKT